MHDPTAVPVAGSRMRFSATVYCKGTTTASGVEVRSGIAAADPALLPVGSVVTVVRLGWDPRASTPGLVDRLFRQRESDRTNTGTVDPSLVRESSDTTPTPQALDDPEPAPPDDAPAVPSELPVVDVDPAVLDQTPAAPDVTGATTDTSAPAPDSAPLN